MPVVYGPHPDDVKAVAPPNSYILAEVIYRKIFHLIYRFFSLKKTVNELKVKVYFAYAQAALRVRHFRRFAKRQQRAYRLLPSELILHRMSLSYSPPHA